MRKSKEIDADIKDIGSPADRVQAELLLDIRNTLVQLQINRKEVINK